MPSKVSFGAKLLRDELSKREISYQVAAQELSNLGHKTQRYSVWQWAHSISKPSLESAFAVAEWTGGRIPPESWTAKNAAIMREGQRKRSGK